MGSPWAQHCLTRFRVVSIALSEGRLFALCGKVDATLYPRIWKGYVEINLMLESVISKYDEINSDLGRLCGIKKRRRKERGTCRRQESEMEGPSETSKEVPRGLEDIEKQRWYMRGRVRSIKLKDRELTRLFDQMDERWHPWIHDRYVELSGEFAKIHEKYCDILDDAQRLHRIKDGPVGESETSS